MTCTWPVLHYYLQHVTKRPIGSPYLPPVAAPLDGADSTDMVSSYNHPRPRPRPAFFATVSPPADEQESIRRILSDSFSTVQSFGGSLAPVISDDLGTHGTENTLGDGGDVEESHYGTTYIDGSKAGSKLKEGIKKKKIACPYMKRYPARFGTRRTCVGPGFDGMHRLREHLKRRHFKEHTCSRCGSEFKTKEVLRRHQRDPTPCTLRFSKNEVGFMTQKQWDAICSRRWGRGSSPATKWKEIYVTLFSDVEEALLPSPYIDTLSPSTAAEPVDATQYDAYLTQHLRVRVIGRMSEEPEFGIITDEAKEKMATILQEEAVMTMQGFHDWKRGGSASPGADMPARNSVEPADVTAWDSQDAGTLDDVWNEDSFTFSFLE